jgi:hypothetical protein
VIVNPEILFLLRQLDQKPGVQDRRVKGMKPFMDVSFVMTIKTLDRSEEEVKKELLELQDVFNAILKDRGYVIGGMFDQNYYPE